MSGEQQVFYNLAVALAIGLLIGIERGWKEREAKEGERVAGERTYGLVGLMGGVTSLLAEQLGPLVVGLAFVGIAGALTTVYVVNYRSAENDAGMTSLVTGLLTFVRGPGRRRRVGRSCGFCSRYDVAAELQTAVAQLGEGTGSAGATRRNQAVADIGGTAADPAQQRFRTLAGAESL
jgi:hypothetical protein